MFGREAVVDADHDGPNLLLHGIRPSGIVMCSSKGEAAAVVVDNARIPLSRRLLLLVLLVIVRHVEL